jgi:hypothetical protein
VGGLKNSLGELQNTVILSEAKDPELSPGSFVALLLGMTAGEVG